MEFGGACDEWRWQNNYEAAYWRAKCVALEYENQQLLAALKDLISYAQPPSYPHTESLKPPTYPLADSIRSTRGSSVGSVNDQQTEDDEDEEDMNRKMWEYMQQTIQHRKHLKEMTENTAEFKAADEFAESQLKPPSEQPGALRTSELQTLYGSHVNKVCDLETKLQVKFDQFCDVNQPKMWPCIPFKL